MENHQQVSLATESHGKNEITDVVAVYIIVYFILSRLLYPAFSANLDLLCMPHLGMGPLV